MAFNFTELIKNEVKKQEEQQGNVGKGGLGFKTVYPFNNGRLEFKLIGNEPSGLLYREIIFHSYYANNSKQKVPCLHHMYGMDCPICDAVSNVQNTLGDDKIFSKYGFNKQGIMFAKLLSVTPDDYFKDTKNPPKPGDIVLFMFPKSVINELRNLIIEYQDEVDAVFTNNTTRNVTLKVGTQANGFPEYTFFVKGNTHTLCVNDSGAEDTAAFNEFMSKMPDLREVKFPSAPTEDMMKIHRTVVETINSTYFGTPVTGNMPDPVNMSQSMENTVNSVSNAAPSTVVGNMPDISSSVETTPIPQTVEPPVQVTPAESVSTDERGERPSCYGDNKYDDVCAKCPWESECV